MKRLHASHLGSIERVYRDQANPPELMATHKGDTPVRGERVLIVDDQGNEVEAVVRRVVVAVSPDFDTFRNPRLEARQESFDVGRSS